MAEGMKEVIGPITDLYNAILAWPVGNQLVL